MFKVFIASLKAASPGEKMFKSRAQNISNISTLHGPIPKIFNNSFSRSVLESLKIEFLVD